MRPWIVTALCLCVAGCGSKEGAGDSAGDTAAGDNAAGDTAAGDTSAGDGGTQATCTALQDGPYGARGSCFGMSMSAQLSFTAETCSFTLDSWDMSMSVNPEGGTVSGDQVTLTGGGMDGCTGSITDGDMSGTCSDGCAWELTYSG